MDTRTRWKIGSSEVIFGLLIRVFIALSTISMIVVGILLINHALEIAIEEKFYYKSHILDVNCGEKFKGRLYEIGVSRGLYVVRYQDMNGRPVELPDGCVKITIETLPKIPMEK